MTVAAVFALSPLMITCTGADCPRRTERPVFSGMTSAARTTLPSIARRRSPVERTRPGEVEVPRIQERRHQRPALRAVVAIFDGERHVLDVEVQGVAVQEQEEHRDEQQDHRACAGRARSAGTPSCRPRAPSSFAPRLLHHVEEHVLERRLNRLQRIDGQLPARPASRRCRPGTRRLERRTAWTAVPNRLLSSTSSIASSARITSTGRGARISTIGRSAKIRLSSLVVPSAASFPAWMSAIRWQYSASSR